MSAQPELWRVSTPEGIFEADLETLKQWILEGCVLPTDKVSKGNLNWIEAGRVPKLKGAFNGDPTPAAEPVSTSYETFAESAPSFSDHSTPAPTVGAHPTTNACHNHPQATPQYVCRMCGAVFCKDCPKFVSGKVPLCTFCGELCRDYRAVTEKVTRVELQRSGFGLKDFVRAIRYPWQHKLALFGGALIYALLLFAGFRGSAFAWVLMFACISNVISQVAWGRLNRSFMPDFSEFSFWDDVLMPGFLGVGIMIVTWGPMIVLVLALMFGVLSGSHQSASLANEAPVAESTAPDPAEPAMLTDPNADLEEAATEPQEVQREAPVIPESGAEASDPTGLVGDLLPYLAGGIFIVLLILVFVGWGVFYYPMALTVAGYTQSFGSVLNPLVGLDTIRRMGITYFKAFGMVIVVQVVAFVVGLIIYVITSPLTLPFMGNLVGNFINATFTFYFNLVIACILGLSLFSCADRLGINVD